ncbi:non-ribosomal peptide synthetase [Flocculibacter collagenilyticus]|uniref:non-ribosomal peptide synthetase n=1 Tax=Flocculibacter collagenilyticus TaxID=2744479 RepID=UPI0018F5180C|nr:non-ribosomal peptide synthetase [Flocculibacter collagenilyticus]
MNLKALIDWCLCNNINLVLEDGNIQIYGDKSLITPDVLHAFKQNKPALVEWLSENAKKQHANQTSIQPFHSESGHYPLSFAQQRLWMVESIEGASSHYNMPGAFKVSGKFDTNLAEQAFAEIVKRHQVLRTQFHASNVVDLSGESAAPYQIINQHPEFSLTLLSISATDDQEAQLRTLANQHANSTFDLSKDLLLKVAFVRLTDDEGVLLINLHHIASDGWSINILVNEFRTLYTSLKQQTVAQLPELPVQYTDYANWQREAETSGKLAESLTFWREQLSGLPNVHNLPLDMPRGAHQTFTALSHIQWLDKALFDELKQFCQQHNITLFMALQAVFAVLLSRWSNENDIVMAVPVAGREQSEVSHLIGCFINTLAFRTQLEPQLTFAELLAQTKEFTLNAFSHQQVPFELLLDELKPERSLAYNTLCQVKLLLQNHELDDFQMHAADFTISNFACYDEQIRFDLDLNVTESERGLHLQWQFKKDLFLPETIARLGQSFEQLLRTILQQPHCSIASLPLSTVQQQQALIALGQGERNAVPASSDTLAHLAEQFAQQAAQTPDAIAVRDSELSLSYQELDGLANRLSQCLYEELIEDEDLARAPRVGIYLPRNAALMVSLLGTLKAGCCYVPFEARNSKGRLGQIIKDADIACVITCSDWVENLPVEGIDLLLLDELTEDSWLHDYDSDALDEDQVRYHSNDSAYVIYTSGSTGTPKGVEVTHHNVIDYCDYAQRSYYHTGLMGSVVVTSHGFDITVPSLYLPLLAGGCVELLPLDDELTHLATHLTTSHQAQLLRMTPMHVSALLELTAGEIAGRHVFVIGGESFPVSVAKALQARFPNSQIFNHYGPSETTVGCTIFDVSQHLSALSYSIPIGRAMANTQLYVLDAQQQLCPQGVTGELYIGGHGVAKGYVNQAALTAEKFIANPFISEATNTIAPRLYRTGDLVRWNAQGQLEYVGRNDNQVKIRGFRIELGDIEASLYQHEAVREAVVDVQGEKGSERLIAFVVAGTSEQATLTDELMAQLKASYPDYMVPAAIEVLAALPKSANGKIDRKALPEFDRNALQQGAYQAPRNQTEQILCDIWQALLNVEQVSINDNFFSLGGDSILSIQMASRAAKQGLKVNTRLLFEYQTIAELAEQVKDTSVTATSQTQVTGEQRLLPIQASFLNQTMQCDEQHAQSVAHYNQAVLLALPTPMSADDLVAIATALYQRHDALRLAFVKADARWQAVYQDDEITTQLGKAAVFNEVNSSNESDNSWLAARCQHYQESFDLSEGPLLKLVQLQSSADAPTQQTRLFIVAHHLVVDGVSWRIILADLAKAQQQLQRGEVIALDNKTTSLQTWAEQLNHYAQSEVLRTELPFWQAQQKPSPCLFEGSNDVPAQSLGLAQQGTAKALSIALSAQQTSALLTQCTSAYNTKINELLLASIMWASHQLDETAQLKVMMEGHGREDLFEELDITETVGWFTSKYPVLLNISGKDAKPSIASVIMQVKEQLRAVPNNGIGYGVLTQYTDELVEQDDDHALLFNYLGQLDQSGSDDAQFTLSNEGCGNAVSDHYLRRHRMGLISKVVNQQLEMTLDFSALQYTTESMQAFLDAIHDALGDVIEHCQTLSQPTLTPSDFISDKFGRYLTQPFVTQANLTQWQTRYHIDKLYPATAMQQGMLFQSAISDNAYIAQTGVTLTGYLEPSLFQQAWQHVINQHDIFKTAFVETDLHTLQLVVKEARLDWHYQDWSDYSDPQVSAALADYKQQDAARGFDVTCAPLTRIAVFKLSTNSFYMLWSYHHALIDGWCSPLIYRDVMQYYQDLIDLRPLQAANTKPYQHYIQWLTAQNQDAAVDYWQQYLKNAEPTELSLPAPSVNEAGLSTSQLNLDTNANSQLIAWAKQHKVTVNTVLQFLWGQVLSRYCGRDDVIFGATISGRPPEVAGVEDMIGLFINTVPVRVKAAQNLAISDELQTLQIAFQNNNHFGYLPLNSIYEAAGQSGIGRLFDSIMVFENYPLDAALKQDASDSLLKVSQLDSYIDNGLPLTLNVSSGAQLRIKFVYQAAMFNKEDINAMVDHMHRLLDMLTAQSGATFTTQQLHTQMYTQQQQQALIALGQGERNAVPASSDTLAHLAEQFAQQAAQTPDAIAVRDSELSLSYQELDGLANRLSQCLYEELIEDEDLARAPRVGIYLPRNAALMVSLLGTLKAGCCYVPFEARNSKGRLGQIIKDADIACVITCSDWVENLPVEGIDLLLLDELTEDSWLHDYDSDALDEDQVRYHSNDSAYVIYTSGSTGTPKGVEVTHHNVIDYCDYAQRSYYHTGLMGSVVVTSHGFDITVPSLYLPLLAGGCVELLPLDDELTHLATHLTTSHQAQLLRMTPMHVSALLELTAGEIAGRHVFVIGGESFPVSVAKALQARFPNSQIFNHYGPSETTVGCTIFDVSQHLSALSYSIPIGRAMANTQLYVLDAQQQLCPQGVTGELYIGGHGVAKGYVNQAALTAEKFIANPFISEATNTIAPRLYRTGDLVRWNAQGQLEYVGRNDNQVKIRGFRIELGDIEASLYQHEAVREAVVDVQGEKGSERLIAFVVAGTSEQATLTDELMAQLKASYPDYMVPAAIEVLAALPKSANGKIDRKALANLAEQQAGARFVAASTETQSKLVAVWSELLNIDEVSVEASFFELGGNSITAMRLVNRINNDFAVTITLQALMDEQTIARLADLIDSAKLIEQKMTEQADSESQFDMEW